MPAPDRAALRYALVTPAWNEEAHLEQLIDTVAAQTVPPVEWVIVSDGSSDRTDAIVKAAAERYPWVRLLRLERSPERNFAGKAHAFNAGYASLSGRQFELIGNLDADITLPADYYEFLAGRFADDAELGVAGTPFVEDPTKPHVHSYAHPFADLRHVSGACQLFRRRCFDDVGGYVPVKQGAIDWVAVTTARMRGWKTQTFLERLSLHHRTMGTADRSVLRARLNHGEKDFLVGGHPGWQMLRSVFQMRQKPLVLGGVCLMAGYAWAWARGLQSPVPQDLRAFHRAEQLQRLRAFVRRPRDTSERRPTGETAGHSPE
jgi:biofilm PGA synthesis N-glycosyltransferase PgaC